MRHITRLSLGFASAALLSCGGDDLVLPTPGDPASVAIVQGEVLTGRVGEQLDEPLLVRVLDSEGAPVANAAVKLDYWNGSARELARQLGKGETPIRADSAGRFRIEGVLPDIPFELFFRNGPTSLVLQPRRPTGKAVAGDTLDLGDLRPRPSE